ncbi:MAG: hypothetical protein J7497_07060 [Chitinophagaceae bacterium]|nr:hypothetical protein [Chitinophagaceae bacterium]
MAVAVLGVVGTSLAFKASKFSTKFCVGTTTNQLLTYSGNHLIDPDATVALSYFRTRKADNVTPIGSAADCTSGLVTNQSTKIVSEF